MIFLLSKSFILPDIFLIHVHIVSSLHKTEYFRKFYTKTNKKKTQFPKIKVTKPLYNKVSVPPHVNNKKKSVKITKT